MVLYSQDFGYPPHFQGRSFRWLAPPSGYKLPVPEIWHFQIGEKCKVCISGAEGRRDSGTSLACSACSNYARYGSRFQVSTTLRFGVR